jgi:uncharacterized protein with HEPN domain
MWRDDAYLLDMLLHARDALSFNAGGGLQALLDDKSRLYATLHALQFAGEAASKISREFRDTHQEIPWESIISLRHRAVPDYARSELPKVWVIVEQRLPPLIDSLAALVPPDVTLSLRCR